MKAIAAHEYKCKPAGMCHTGAKKFMNTAPTIKPQPTMTNGGSCNNSFLYNIIALFVP